MAEPSRKCRATVRKYIRENFPDMSGVKPSVSSREYAGNPRHRFTFRGALRSTDGGSFRQIVHLTTDEEGRVLKISVSR